ncbi:hypothetical protein ABZS86_07875 [Streptomyces sp. NPDC005355]|uniref:hypothetical protein n=1 Tax=Streptomyces sp. NPDC005355 TaxID=3157038 RepID=UPI00339E0340
MGDLLDGSRLRMNPLAPASSASKTYSSFSNVVITMTLGGSFSLSPADENQRQMR